uniref:Islet amyloid polypeptide n=2 Tax=Sus scrofa TaxID=9823 RepID=A0A8D0XB14_PIG
MSILKLPVILIVFSVALNHLEATSIEKQEWLVPVLPRNMLLELKGAKTESEINPKVIRWKNRNATWPLVRLNTWQIF